jgi:hypothetical protein
MYSSPSSNGLRRYICHAKPGTPGCGRMSITAPPLEDLIVEVVIRRLDTPALAKRLKRRDEAGSSSGDDAADLEVQLADLAEMFGAGDLTKAEWLRAKARLDARLADLRRREDKAAKTAIVAALPGKLRDAWPKLPTERQRGILAAVIAKVTVGPATKRGPWFDPDRITIEWVV